MSKENLIQGTFSFPGHCPSWKKHSEDQGFAELHYMAHDEAKWLTLSTTESGEKSSRQTIITMDKPHQILELAQVCLQVLGVPEELRAQVTIAALDVQKRGA